MNIIKLAWLGTRTDNDATDGGILPRRTGLRSENLARGFWVLKLPDGIKVEIFGPATDMNGNFTTGPVAGFAGVEILVEPQFDAHGNAWVHFRAPGQQTLPVDRGRSGDS